MEDATVFDSPLQEATAMLMQLAVRLEELGLEAEVNHLEGALERLKSNDLHNARPMGEMDTEGTKVDPQLREWLEAMEWCAPSTQSPDAAVLATDTRLSTLAEEQSVREEAVVANAEEKQWLPPLLYGLIGGTVESEVLRMLEHDVMTWEMDVLRLAELTGGHALSAIGWALVEHHGIRSALGVTPAVIAQFFKRVEEGYNDVPYHNSTHASCVTHAVMYLSTQFAEVSAVSDTPLDRFISLLSGCVHDLNHTGHNNGYHVATESDLAIRYSDQSVLEMHHLASAFSLLQEKDCQLIAKLPLEQRKLVRNRCIAMVLATDLSFNFPTINAFKTMVQQQDETQKEAAAAAAAITATAGGDSEIEVRTTMVKTQRAGSVCEAGPRRTRRRGSTIVNDTDSATNGAANGRKGSVQLSSAVAASCGAMKVLPLFTSRPDMLKEPERLLVLKMIIKVSDIGNVAKGQPYALQWTDRVVKEFFDQGDLERKLGLPVLPFMDKNVACLPKQQIGFYDFVVKPMFEAMDLLLPMDEPLANLDIMYGYWRGQMPAEEDVAAVLAPKPTAKPSIDSRASRYDNKRMSTVRASICVASPRKPSVKEASSPSSPTDCGERTSSHVRPQPDQ